MYKVRARSVSVSQLPFVRGTFARIPARFSGTISREHQTLGIPPQQLLQRYRVDKYVMIRLSNVLPARRRSALVHNDHFEILVEIEKKCYLYFAEFCTGRQPVSACGTYTLAACCREARGRRSSGKGRR
uniref:Uncharacterized protein n=1 Tax=Sipha flava TaxID=143950 RepID=A0A2S2QT92_9HEMI